MVDFEGSLRLKRIRRLGCALFCLSNDIPRSMANIRNVMKNRHKKAPPRVSAAKGLSGFVWF